MGESGLDIWTWRPAWLQHSSESTRLRHEQPVYSTCLHCHHPLGANEVIETCQVGRRLAFDASRGRLWVVCPRCREWNLTPIEERWEAIDECERRFRGTRLRVSTDNIGVAKLSEGLELVRIGMPLVPEMAAWRYGEQFKRRRSVGLFNAAAFMVPMYAVQVLMDSNTIPLGVSALVVTAGVGGMVYYAREAWRPRIMLDDGRVVRLQTREMMNARFDTRGDSWVLRWRRANDATTLAGGAAERALRSVLAAANRSGGRPGDIRGALELLDRVGGGERFFNRLARAWPAGHARGLHALSPDVRLALEMALHEETERRALDGELAELEAEWRVAEEIAAISDNLFTRANRSATLPSIGDRSAT